MRRISGIPSLLMSLAAAGFCLFGVVEALTLADYYNRVAGQMDRWCRKATGCVDVTWTGNFVKPEVTVAFRRGHPLDRQRVVAELTAKGLLTRPRERHEIVGRVPKVVVTETDRRGWR